MRRQAAKGPKSRSGRPRLRLVGSTPASCARRGSSSAVARWIPMRHAIHIRWSKVMTAQARMAVGYYDRDDVKERVLDAVLKELIRH